MKKRTKKLPLSDAKITKIAELARERAKSEARASTAPKQSQREPEFSLMPTPISKVVVWNSAGGEFQIDCIDEDGDTACSVALEDRCEAMLTAARFASTVGCPCYRLRLSWLVIEERLAYLPTSMKLLHAVIQSESLEPVWN